MPVSDHPSGSTSAGPSPTSPARSWLARNATLLAAVLISLHIGLGVSSALQKSATFDEGFHITAGAANWLGADFRLHSGNGVLAQTWFALPIALAPGRFSVPNPDVVIENQPVGDFHLLTFYLARVFFYEMGNSPSDILLYARTMGLVLGALLCALVFAWSRHCFGPLAALLSCALCALSPTILAHSRLATSDLIFTLCLLVAVGAVWRTFWKPSLLSLSASGLALGALALTKLSSLGVVPMIAVLLALRAVNDSPLQLDLAGRRFSAQNGASRLAALLGLVIAQGLVAIAVIWLAYGLRFDAVPEGKSGRETMNTQWEWALERDSAVLGGIDALRSARLLPEAYLYSAAFVWRQADERKSFFLGEVRNGGDPRFFPTAIATKTPLALFGLVGLAWIGAMRRRDAAAVWDRGMRGCTPLLVAAGVHGAFIVTSDINLGLRHALPLYPVAFIVAGSIAREATLAQSRWLAPAVVALMASFGVSSTLAWPHYLAYFNATTPRGEAHTSFVDSSLDWGQDLDALARELSARGTQPSYLSYFGTADPLHHGFDSELAVRRLPGFFDWPGIRAQWNDVHVATRLEPGLYAISATMLQQVWSAPSRAGTKAEAAEYATLHSRFAALLDASDEATRLARLRTLLDRDTANSTQAARDWMRFSELRLARLTRELRKRAPDDQVGFSILLYEVDAAELERINPSR